MPAGESGIRGLTFSSSRTLQKPDSMAEFSLQLGLNAYNGNAQVCSAEQEEIYWYIFVARLHLRHDVG